MPSDIRSFFGGKPSVAPPAEKPNRSEKAKGRGRARKVIDDEDDDDGSPTKTLTPKRSAAEKKAEPVLLETTADDFFGKGAKPKRAETAGTKGKKKPGNEDPKMTPKKSNGQNGIHSARSSARSKKSVNYLDVADDDFPEDALEDDESHVFKAGVSARHRKGDGYEEGTEDENGDAPALDRQKEQGKKQIKLKGHTQDVDADGDLDMKQTDPDDDFVVPDEDEEIVASRPARKTDNKTTNKKRKSTALDDDDELEVEPTKTPNKRAAAPKKPTAVKKPKTAGAQDSAELTAIFDSIPTIEPPPPPPKSGEEDSKPKFQYGQHANSAVPAGALDMSQLPTGEENCLAGLSFVFTGQLATIGRDQGQQLVKQYGGKSMTTPSSKTSYVVLGEGAGPKKLHTIEQHKLKVINEEGLFELIRRLPANGGDSAAAGKQADKRAKEEENIRKAAEEIEQQERARLAAAKPKPQAAGVQSPAPSTDKGKAAAGGPDSRLWTVRYAPQSLAQICGNKAQVEKLGRWLRAFPKNQRTKFRMPGPDGSGTFRAVMIHGPPGIGKTTAAHLVAKLEGYDIVESNASDARSKKLVESGLKGVLSTTSLMGYFAHGSDTVEAAKKKLVLIMDEVDGMSAGDRGGVGALAAVCKKAQIPMILICNDRRQPKMKPFEFVTYDMPFRRPTADMIRSRISTIAYREDLKIPANVINALIEGSGADIRQVVNMISTAKLDTATMSFEEGKDMSKAWEKHIVLKPWDMVGKILNGNLFNPASNSTLNDKQELYFNDHEFAPLMLQENYLGTNPMRSSKFNGEPKKKSLAALELVCRASQSISDGDLIDRMIHGSQQQWSLMPAHAMASFVRPSSFVYGSMAGNQTRFTAWLGKNSNQNKLIRFVKDIQGHMRLRTSADRHEIRQTYLPTLFTRLIKKLENEGKDAVPDVIELMDSYFLTKDDWDAILELGVGDSNMEKIKIESSAKAAFTRQ